MVDCAIAAPMSLDFAKVAADTSGSANVSSENAFVSAIEQVSPALVENSAELIKAPMLEIEAPSTEDLVPANKLLMTGLKQAIKLVMGETESIQIPQELDIQVAVDPTVGLVETQYPTSPVYQVLSKELPAEDLRLYASPAAIQQPEEQAGTAEKVTFTPGAQMQAKPEMAPKFVEAIQQGPLVAEAIQQSPMAQEVIKPQVVKKETFDVQKTEPLVPINENTESDVVQPNKPVTSLGDNAAENILEVAKTKTKTTESVLELGKSKAVVSANFEQPQIISSTIEAKQAPIILTPAQVAVKAPQIIQDVAVHMKKAFDQSLDKITIQVNPPSLGKIEVELHFSNDGRVNAILMADKVETYDLLKQNPQLLKEALAGQGMSPDSTDLSFNLRGEQDAQKEQSNKGSGSKGNKITGGDQVIESSSYRQAPVMNSSNKVDIHA